MWGKAYKLFHLVFQMVELHSFKDCDFTLTNNENFESKEACETSRTVVSDDNDDDVDEITNDLKAYKQQLNLFLSVIKKQNEISRRSIEQLKAYAKG
jgi:hypothetical protein